MRILRVRFKNLNSLAGEWEIDLTHPAFVSECIFAITGPTGAGKSTILDAVCLGLYGRTPRLNKVTKGDNEVMSRRTGECFAEVAFETQAGRFRCHWFQHRSRKKPDGELQAPKHEIADADSGEILESKILEVAGRVEKVTGMDFDRFTRTMLLAQGGFAAFLQAAPDERAPILEEITGTDIYSRISVRVHERLRGEREEVRILQAETDGIAMLTPEQEHELQRDLETKLNEEADLAVKFAGAGKAMAWLNAIDGLRQEIIGLDREAEALRVEIDAFKSDSMKLRDASRAASLDGEYATLLAMRKQQGEDGKALKDGEAALPGLESSAVEQAEALKAAEQSAVAVKGELRTSLPALQMIRSLDQKLAGLRKAISTGEESRLKDVAAVKKHEEAGKLELKKRSEAENELRLVDVYLEEHARDEWLIGGLAGVEEQLRALLSGREGIARKETEFAKAGQTLKQSEKLFEDRSGISNVRRRESDEAVKELQQGRDALLEILGGRLLREYRAEKEALLRETAFLKKIAELEDHRSKLEDGKPCPLCGAVEHPFAKGNVPVPDEMELEISTLSALISRAEAQEATVRKLEEAENSARKNLTEAEKQETAAANERNIAEKTLAGINDDLEELRVAFAERRDSAAAGLMRLGISDIPETGISELLESLKARLKAWQDRVGSKAGLEKRIADIDRETTRLHAVITTLNINLQEKNKDLEILKDEYRAGSEERIAVFGEGNPDDEEARLNKAVSDAERAEKEVRDRHNELQQKWNTAKAYVEALKKRIEHREPELKGLEAEFSAALAHSGFSDELRFLNARLTPGERDELSAKAKELDERGTELNAGRKDRETRLAAEISKKLTDESAKEMESRLGKYETALKEARECIAGLKHKLSENAAAGERMREKQEALEARKTELRRWENLHALIGAADGKKFRNFAQGLTFESMVGHANRQLQKLTDRYLLTRDDSQPLELNVIDNYQAGEIRSTKNLSGGESFIVSLALALGLSHMAGRNVRVDSLFLDEGFGTLDEDALDTALETLAGLRRDGKLIGVISHVPALKERISAQIQVTPHTGGRSRISGPGCREVTAAE